MKTISEIMKSKISIEKDIRELINDFQTESGCQVVGVDLTFSSTIGQTIDPVISSSLEVRLPRR